MAKKRHKTAHQKVLQSIEREGAEKCQLMYGAAAIALNRHFGKGKDAINAVFEASKRAWNECANDVGKSMVRMCEEETGVEIQIGDGKSWHDLPYLNGDTVYKPVTNAQWVYMRMQQIKWVAPQVMGCILIALHRELGYGGRRCAEAYSKINAVMELYNNDAEAVRRECWNMLGIDSAIVGTTA